MRQVPRYMIIGAGRVARHFSRYLQFIELPFLQWSRSSTESLTNLVEKSTHILLLIDDNAIEPFISANPLLQTKQLIHFSGKLITPLASSAHPLMTFGPTLYSLEKYQTIPFIIEQEGPEFNKLLPKLPNPHYKVSQQSKPFYHALCVMGNNYTTLLWRKLLNDFENKLSIPKEAAFHMLEQTCHNLMSDYKRALTGPLIRNDQETILSNLSALENDPYRAVYEAFVEAYRAGNEEE